MTPVKYIFVLILLSILAFPPTKCFSQDDDDGENKMSQAEWHLKRDQYATSAITLLSRLETLNEQIDSLKQVNRESDSILTNSENILFTMVGASREQVAEFRTRFNETESRLSSEKASPSELRSEVDYITDSKIRCLPEFAERYDQMLTRINYLAARNILNEVVTGGLSYVVESGDCLWRIADMKYGNPLLWPAIWDANRSGVVNKDNVDYYFERRVYNPNLIFPGQVLKIPELSLPKK